MSGWLKRAVVLSLIGAGVGWLLRSKADNGAGRAPVIGGDTWPPVPVKTAGHEESPAPGR